MEENGTVHPALRKDGNRKGKGALGINEHSLLATPICSNQYSQLSLIKEPHAPFCPETPEARSSFVIKKVPGAYLSAATQPGRYS